MHMPNSEGQEDPCNPIVKSVRVKEACSGVPIRNGVAENSTIVRVDIFKKKGQYYFVPIYSWNKSLPNRACQGKNKSDWVVVDDSYEWCFSVRTNDLLKIVIKGKTYFDYYITLDVHSDGRIRLLNHDRQEDDVHYEKGEFRILIKNADSINKYNVDVLGNYYLAKPEKRLELA